MMNYFNKRFERIEKKLQQPSNKNAKTKDTFKFKHKGNRIEFEFNQRILQIIENLSSALNNDDTSEVNDLCDELTVKLKRRNKLIKMADRSALGWETVAEYEADPIASDSEDRKKIRQAKNRALTKYKSKKSNKLTLHVPSQKPSDQQYHLSNDYIIQEFELKNGNNYTSVKGRLKKNLIFWIETLSANSTILEIIDNGCKIPFFKTAKGTSFQNNHSALKNKDFVEESISELLKCGYVTEAEESPEVINPLSVSINSSGKQRLILELRYVNTHIYKDKIKF